MIKKITYADFSLKHVLNENVTKSNDSDIISEFSRKLTQLTIWNLVNLLKKTLYLKN